MRRVIVTAMVALAAAACGGDAPVAASSSTTTTVATTTTTTTSTTTTTTIPSGPGIIGEGDRGLEVQTLQELLTCAGYGTLEPDGVFGARTAAAVEYAQETFGRSTTGEPDDETFGLISRECDRAEVLDLGGDGTVEVFGNAVDGDPDVYSVGAQRGSVITLESGDPVTLTVEGEDGLSFTGTGGLAYESPAAQVAAISVTAPGPTTYHLRVDLAPPGEGGEDDGGFVVEGPFEAGDWIGMEFDGGPPGGLVDYGGAVDCVGEESDSPCHDYRGTIVARPGSFTGSGADNPVEAMAWLLRRTGAEVDGQAVWEIVDAAVFEAPIGDTVLDDCYPQGGDRDLVAHADVQRGAVTAAVRWDWVDRAIEVIPPDRVVCVDGAGDQVAVGPGFG